MRVLQRVERLTVLNDLIGWQQAGRRSGIDAVQPRQRHCEVVSKVGASIGELIIAQDLAGDGLALEVTQDHVRRTQIALVGGRRNHFGHRHPTSSGGAKHRKLVAHVTNVSATLTLKNQHPLVGTELPSLA